MKGLKTQQFAKFYLKDIKRELQKKHHKKNAFDDLNCSSSN